MYKYFEYRFVRGSINFNYGGVGKTPLRAEDEVKLNELGRQGWEVVSFFQGTGRPEGGIGSKRMVYLLKKEFSDPRGLEMSVNIRNKEIEDAGEFIKNDSR